MVVDDIGMRKIHETAIIGLGTTIGRGVTIGAYAIIGDGVVVGRDCVLGSHAILKPGTILGCRAMVDSFAVVGGDPQDQSFDSEIVSGVRIGDRVILREGVTVHRSTAPGGLTEIGADTLLMVNSHVGHDNRIGKNVVAANGVLLAGCVHVGDHAFLGGGAAVHQQVRVGEGAMVGGHATVSYDVPPFTIVAERNCVYGLNLHGLMRREFSEEMITDLKACYRAVFRKPGDLQLKAAAATRAKECGTTEVGRKFLEFFGDCQRGFVRPRSQRSLGALDQDHHCMSTEIRTARTDTPPERHLELTPARGSPRED